MQHTSLGPVHLVLGHLDGLAGGIVDDFARFLAGVLVHDGIHPGRLARALVDELELDLFEIHLFELVLNLGAERRALFRACTALGGGSAASHRRGSRRGGQIQRPRRREHPPLALHLKRLSTESRPRSARRLRRDGAHVQHVNAVLGYLQQVKGDPVCVEVWAIQILGLSLGHLIDGDGGVNGSPVGTDGNV